MEQYRHVDNIDTANAVMEMMHNSLTKKYALWYMIIMLVLTVLSFILTIACLVFTMQNQNCAEHADFKKIKLKEDIYHKVYTPGQIHNKN